MSDTQGSRETPIKLVNDAQSVFPKIKAAGLCAAGVITFILVSFRYFI